jgi:chain length determinant protein tyrosine kinase EpsG
MNQPITPNVSPTNSDKSIGDIIRQTNNLTSEQVEAILEYQKAKAVKFGEAAVALGLVKREQVLWALSQQFDYPYAADKKSQVNSELIVANRPFGENSEFFRSVRSQLISALFAEDGVGNALAVVSPSVGDGKSYFCANLAAAFSQLGGRTLLIDADLRNPRQQEIFSIASVEGLSGILAGRNQANIVKPVPDLPSLYVLPVGIAPPNPLELVQRPAFSMLLNELKSKFNYIIVDTPADSRGADSIVIAAAVGATVAVARRGATSMRDLGIIAQRLQKSSKFLGVVINDHQGTSERRSS